VLCVASNQDAGMLVMACDDAIIRSYSAVETTRFPTKGTHVWSIDWSPLGGACARLSARECDVCVVPFPFAAGLADGTALVVRPPKKLKQKEKAKRAFAVCGVGR
jgi:hypothetical protein